MIIIAIILFMVLTSFSQAEPEPVKISVSLILAFLVGIYEVVARLIPTIKNYSLIAKIINILVWVSDFLNRKKK